MRRLAELGWRLLPGVRSAERSRVAFFTTLLTLVSSAQTMGLAGSEALLLARLGAESLPATFIGASLATVLGSILYASRVGAARNDRLFAQMLLGSGALLLVAAVGAHARTPWLLPVLFAFFYLSQAVFLNHFWTFSGDYFDTLASKRVFPVFTVGASAGGLLGGAATALVTRAFGPAGPIVGWGLLLLAAALQLRAFRRPLRRWGPLELEEADETSVEGMRGAVRYLRGSALGRWFVLSATGMVLALFVAQYLYSDVFARAYPEASDLATFLGTYLAVTNGIEIALELAFTPWLIRRFGVASANLLHPLLTLASFGGLAAQYALPSALGARANRELLENAVAQPVRNLAYNALPLRFRGRLRAFVEGVVVYAGMSAAGVLLLALGRPDPRWLAAAGAVAALLYLGSNLVVRREYLHTLVSGIRAGRLDLAGLDDALGGWETTRLAGLCEQLLRDERGRPSRPLRQLIALVGQRGLVEPLVLGASHASPEVRRLCVEALRGAGEGAARDALVAALADEHAEVRRAALRGLDGADAAPALAGRLQALCDDPDADVRAEAATRLGAEGVARLRAMLRSTVRDEALAALRLATPALRDEVLALARHADPALRAAALERASAWQPAAPLPAAELADALTAREPAVRRAAALALAQATGDPPAAALAAALADPDTDVQRIAVAALARAGERGVEAALPLLRDDRERAVEGALRAIAASETSRGRRLLASELRHRVRQIWFRLLAYQRLADRRLAERGRVAADFLRLAYADALLRSRRLAFVILELLEDERVVRKLGRALRFGTARARADALEVLSNLGDRESAQLLVLLHERGDLAERIRPVRALLGEPGEPSALVDASRRSEVAWVRMAAEALARPLSDDLGDNPGDGPADGPGNHRAGIAKMERLLALKQVPLFANLTLDQLEAVHQLTRELTYLPGELIVREGEVGSELFLLLEGSVEVFLHYDEPGRERLNVIEAVGYFGEMAVLADEPRSASIVARAPSRLLALDGASLKELVLHNPEISFEIFRVLSARVRAAERRGGPRQAGP